MHQVLCCGYSLESSQRDDSNEYPQHRVCKRMKGFRMPRSLLSGAVHTF